jgi:DNA repair protein RadC
MNDNRESIADKHHYPRRSANDETTLSRRFSKDDLAKLAAAKDVLAATWREVPLTFNSPGTIRDFCQTAIVHHDVEIFLVIYLDKMNRLIEYRQESVGTIDCATVYPRNIIKSALELNATQVILSHNHPTGEIAPSRADLAITQTLRQALALVDIKVLDHIIVAATQTLSFAQRGLL